MTGAGWSNQEKRDGNFGRKILLLLTLQYFELDEQITPLSSLLLIYILFCHGLLAVFYRSYLCSTLGGSEQRPASDRSYFP